MHPDKNKTGGAEEAFKILAHAFEDIGEPVRTQCYCKVDTVGLFQYFKKKHKAISLIEDLDFPHNPELTDAGSNLSHVKPWDSLS